MLACQWLRIVLSREIRPTLKQLAPPALGFLAVPQGGC